MSFCFTFCTLRRFVSVYFISFLYRILKDGVIPEDFLILSLLRVHAGPAHDPGQGPLPFSRPRICVNLCRGVNGTLICVLKPFLYYGGLQLASRGWGLIFRSHNGPTDYPFTFGGWRWCTLHERTIGEWHWSLVGWQRLAHSNTPCYILSCTIFVPPKKNLSTPPTNYKDIGGKSNCFITNY